MVIFIKKVKNTYEIFMGKKEVLTSIKYTEITMIIIIEVLKLQSIEP